MTEPGGRVASGGPAVVLFDLGGVLVDIDLDRSRERWERLVGQGAPGFDAVFFESGLKARMDVGPLPISGLEEAVSAAAGTVLGAEAILEVWNACLLPNAAALVLAQRVAARARVGVLSDTDPFHAAAICALPELAEAVEHWTFSFEVGALKPQAAMYQAALARFGAPAGSALLLDDKPGNVDGARALGMDASQCTGVASVEAALAARGLLG